MKDKEMKKITLAEIVACIPVPYTVRNGSGERYIHKLSAITSADEYSLAFISKDIANKQEYLERAKAGIIICDNHIEVPADNTKCLILVSDPKVVFSIIGNHFFVPQMPSYGIHPSSIIHPDAVVHPGCYIGPLCVIGKATVGEGSYLHAQVTLYDDVHIGRNVKIHAGTVIGAEGFGYNKTEDGVPVQFPHIGGVVIEDNVEIGSNTSIDRGALNNTIIRKWARIDNLVHIAHNCIIGEYAWVIAGAMIGGSTVIGNHAYIAPSVSLRDQLKIGDNAFVGLGAVVVKNIPDNERWVGVPAKPIISK
jgi:UDP-3-O-[3-hydroxymyristoyl] glucosamine N-acyltransferase